MQAPRSSGSSILDQILIQKGAEVLELLSRADSIRSGARSRPVTRLVAGALRGQRLSVIAEYKRRSPSAGVIRADLSPDQQARAYQAGGAAMISILTDHQFFGGSLNDLELIKTVTSIPLLRKDFVVHEIQLEEARAAGADCVLLIVRCLEFEELKSLFDHAKGLGLSVLVEAHNGDEVEQALSIGATIVGINNRDLANFTVDAARTSSAAGKLGPEVIFVAESGIRSVADAQGAARMGADAVLVGETLMRAADPEGEVRAMSSIVRVGR